MVTPSGEPHSQCQCQCGVLDDTSRTSPLQGHLTVLKVTVCHTAGHYGEEYDDCSWSEPAIHRPTHLRSSLTVNEDSIVCTRTLRLFAAVSFLWVTLVRRASFIVVATAIRGQYGTAKVRHVITTQSPRVHAEVIYCRCPHSMRSRVSK